MFKGIDISYWQSPSNISYDKIADQIDFAILRLAYTSNADGKTIKLDSAFYTHYDNLSKRNIPLGLYFFSTAMTKEQAINEAKFILNEIKKNDLKLEYGIWFDTESSNGKFGHEHVGKDQLTDIAVSFCEEIEKNGFYVGIYANEWWFNNKLTLSKIERYDKWVANWSEEPKLKYGMWQVSDSGKLLGYAFNLDMNTAVKNYPEIYSKMHKKEVPNKQKYFVYGVTSEPEKYSGLEVLELK